MKTFAWLGVTLCMWAGCATPAREPGPKPRPPRPEPTPWTGTETLGKGEMSEPAAGPPPREAAKLTGRPFVLVKNWNFGTGGTIKSMEDLVAEFQFHDQFDTIANGKKYGSVIMAPTAATAIRTMAELKLPDNMQPVEDPRRPNREWTKDTLVTHVRPLSVDLKDVAVSAYQAGNGSFMAKWKLPSGGEHLQKDLLWETRARIPRPQPGYWFALWTAGNRWDGGAEMDVVESFGVPHLGPGAPAFHVNSVGGIDLINYENGWPRGLTEAGVPRAEWDLRQWHVWTWVYLKDDKYQVYFDGHLVQHGNIHWTFGAKEGAPVIDMRFLFDFSWGHQEVSGCNITLPASSFPITYEIDYSRVYLR